MKKVPVVIVWAVAFAFVESAVVEYLRAIYSPLEKGGFQFPVLTLQQINAMGPDHVRRLMIELGREMATLVMLGTVGVVAGTNRREAWAHFMIAFGVWDIFYYLWLKLFIDWPESLMTWDLLFLVPVPWTSPVIAPVIISVALVAAGLTVIYFESRATPVVAGWGEWATFTAGGAMVIISFCWDYENIMSGGTPSHFHWPLFFGGLSIALATFVRLLLHGSRGWPG